ncbi:hypothetical protein KY328_01410 [Candidatus Woesearchaeota archaeon]|nr:hypothetical protein [Candidatus Woesearchaeota archaeon]MBW3021554.1 hypothetical protein [Candidatus Woesearchaeota archaeon]
MIPFKYFKAALFDDHAIEAVGSYANKKTLVFSLILVVLLQALPLTYEEIFTTHLSFLKIFAQFFGALLVMFVVAKLFKSKTSFTRFVYGVSTVVLFAAMITTVLAYVSLFVFEYLLNTAAVSNLVTSILPFYIVVLFGFTVDIVSDIKKWHWLIGIVSVGLLYGVYFFL